MNVHVRLLGFYQMMLGRMYEDIQLRKGASLDELWNYFQSSYVQLQSEDMKRIAGMSVNKTYIPRKNWRSFVLQEGDKVDLLSQMAGG